MKDFISGIIGVSVFVLYLFGMYTIIVDDHRYTTKDVVIAAVVFPYSLWVGGRQTYRLITVSSEDREIEEQCLDTAEALRAPRNARLRYCECYTEMKDAVFCQSKIFAK